MGAQQAEKLLGQGMNNVIQEQLNEALKENEIYKGLLGHVTLAYVTKLEEDNKEKDIKIGKLEENIKVTKELSEKTLKHSQKTMQGQKKSVNDDNELLKARIEGLKNLIETLKKDKEDLELKHERELLGKDKLILEQSLKINTLNDKVADRDEEIKLIKDVKYNTENILVKIGEMVISSVGVSIEDIIGEIESRGNLVVMEKNIVDEFTGLVQASKNSIINCTKNKVLVKNREDVEEKINIIIDVENNHGSTSVGIARKYKISPSGLSNKVTRLKDNGIYDLVKKYIQAGNEVTSEIEKEFGVKLPDYVEVLKDITK